MATEIRLNRKYAPLFRPRTRYAVIEGGRGSGKSFAVASVLIGLTEQPEYEGKTILFTRYTLTNAETSIMPEFIDKIDRGGMQGRFHKSGNEITNLRTGCTILFRGIKTSSGINTAALKSIPNLALWVNDESEELVDEAVFDTIDLSIRAADVRCGVWLILNPPDVTHFVYRKFYAGNGVKPPFNGVQGDVTYIHTTYLDNLVNLPAEYVEKAERMRETDPKKYRHLWLGEWECNREGLVFPGWERMPDTEWPTGLPTFYGLDWGFSPDPTAVVRCAYDPASASFWLREVACANKSIPEDVAPLIIADAQSIGLYPQNTKVICDSATPAGIESLRRCGLDAVPADKKDKEYQIGWLREMRVRYYGQHIGDEAAAYSFIPSKYDRTIYTKTPQDGNDHFMDACFVGETMIATPDGEKPIKDIEEGDLVLTSEGPKKVLHKWSNGVKYVWEYEIKTVSCSIKIKATPEHKIKTLQEWKPISQLREGDSVFLLKTLTEGHTSNISGRVTSPATNGRCTALSGNTITAKSQPDTKYTTRTGIPQIMRLKTLNVSPPATTNKSTRPTSVREFLRLSFASICAIFKTWRKNGIVLPKDTNGTPNMGRKWRQISSPSVSFANVAGKNFTQSPTDSINSAPIIANQKPAAPLTLTILQKTAPIAESPSRLTNTPARNVAQPAALQSIVGLSAGSREVFDLEVEGCHEYFANGILVHNCRYGCFTFVNHYAAAGSYSFGFGSEYSIFA